MSILKLQKRYNEVIVRIDRAEKFLGSLSVSQSEISKWRPKFCELGEEAENLITDIEKSGRHMTVDEILNGFKDIR